jgi:glycosyltransferase involved in cell wall biosynthesis
MSDVMPYASTRFSSMDQLDLEAYLGAWGIHIEKVVEAFEPDVIHCHHVWLLGSIIKDIAPCIPVVTHCHGTGFRQMELCPALARGVAEGCARNKRFVALHRGHADRLTRTLDVPRERIDVVGAGYRDDVFHARGRGVAGPRVLFAGKYSRAKGLPWLLDAFERVSRSMPSATLEIAGGGAGPESNDLARRMLGMRNVTLHGNLSQEGLSDLMRGCAVCALPSFYEGLPLVLVEALACGCRLLSTDLDGVRDFIAPRAGYALRTIPMPRLEGADVPFAEDLPAFVDRLAAELEASLIAPPLDTESEKHTLAMTGFTWSAVFREVEKVWLSLV